MPKRDYLTATDFYRYLQCPHWPYWERFRNKNMKRAFSEHEEQMQADGLEHEKRIVKTFFPRIREVRVKNAEKGFCTTLMLMKKGMPLIYQGWLLDGDWAGRPDLLERHEGKSAFGNWYYVPLDIKRAHEIKKEHKAQLAFYAVLLDRIQKRFPGQPQIVNRDGERLTVGMDDFMDEFKEMTLALERIRAGERPEPVFKKSCVDNSPWSNACFELAKERNDIALLFNVDVRKLKSLRDVGVRTVDDATVLNPEKLEGKAPGLTLKGLESVKRQARSLQNRLVIIRRPFQDPQQGVEIHFDIESHPPTDTDYLYGFWLGDHAHGAYKAFVAKTLGQEKKMWREFLAWLPTLPAEYTVYHYAAYERMRLAVLAKRYGDEKNPWLVRFKERFVDLKEAAREHAVFPLYFYSLKQICKFLGFRWTSDVQGGRESVIAFEKWRKTKKQKILDEIIEYNKGDVEATAFLLNWLRTYAKTEKEYQKPYPWEK